MNKQQHGTLDAKVEKSYSANKQGSFKPTKPDDIARPQNIKLPPPPSKAK